MSASAGIDRRAEARETAPGAKRADTDGAARMAQASRPNILIVMLDDIPGDVVPRLLERMPIMQSLFVKRGMHFPNFFIQDPLCCPGRVGFLTGLYSRHHGVRTNWAPKFQASESIATALDRVGYHTMIVGRYLNGSNRLRKMPPGWDRVSIFLKGGYHDYEMYVDATRQGFGSEPSDYSTDVLADMALGYIRQAPADTPLFLWWSPMAVHNEKRDGAIVAPPPAPRHRAAEQCRRIGFRRTPAYNERDVSDKPPWIRKLDYTRDPLYHSRGYPLRPVCETLLSVDEAVGEMVGLLRQQGRYDDTLFILTADNGMAWGDHRRRAKSVPWSTHVPFYIRWKAGLGNKRGTIRTFAQNTDVAPTLAGWQAPSWALSRPDRTDPTVPRSCASSARTARRRSRVGRSSKNIKTTARTSVGRGCGPRASIRAAAGTTLNGPADSVNSTTSKPTPTVSRTWPESGQGCGEHSIAS